MGTETRGDVLVVDDDPTIVGVLVQALEEEGYGVRAAVGEMAVRLARAERPGLVLLGLMRPGTGGVEVSRQLRGDRRTAGVPIVALVGAEAGRAAAAVPVDAVVAAPFDLDTLYALVARWLRAA